MPAKKYFTEEEREAARKAQRHAWYEANKAAERQRADERRRTRPEVREMERASVRAYDEAHREERRQKARVRYWAKREELLAQRRAARAADPEAARERTRAWKAANPGAQRMYQAKRAGLQVDGDLTPQDWREILEEFAYRCGYCGADGRMEVEHMTPLSAGGQHTRSNVIPACRSCNASKGSRDLLGFLEMKAAS